MSKAARRLLGVAALDLGGSGTGKSVGTEEPRRALEQGARGHEISTLERVLSALEGEEQMGGHGGKPTRGSVCERGWDLSANWTGQHLSATYRAPGSAHI